MWTNALNKSNYLFRYKRKISLSLSMLVIKEPSYWLFYTNVFHYIMYDMFLFHFISVFEIQFWKISFHSNLSCPNIFWWFFLNTFFFQFLFSQMMLDLIYPYPYQYFFILTKSFHYIVICSIPLLYYFQTQYFKITVLKWRIFCQAPNRTPILNLTLFSFFRV